MQRSTINDLIADAAEMIARHGFVLPPFANWSPDDFVAQGERARRIIDSGMGWDVTDYGLGTFDETGLVLFTLRNGALADLQRGRGMCYAEKLLITREDQLSPMHTHVMKAEDIINRGGGTLALELFGSDSKGGFAEDRGVQVRCDGIPREIGPGEVLRLAPGESVTLMPGDWHAFWGEGGDVLVGEVSTVNDDVTDNVFRDEIGRFPAVDEDVAPSRLLVSDYATWLPA
ncbi:hypothetical protein SAMN04490244_101550 [Tranquillimonas rosea]|uniref:D-lyxose ketol-isomerase n=1 Tax=Tranquillimonas rosea TaxID=641238 RepID=A0A1H9QBC9_9RHOB|nr:D-lyxose/D-mannose family sugar isomerase [Tranquillimonas rosea]SER57740.1 hypothetical protein SAMN04490244_101550 [Tranquillimonas rosea]